ncbi:hypothetical protein FS935_04645 [Metabacillus litoralis]|uniref:DUF5658 domain-containing protein n=1 Tax=Metabacillus litoralis TaxID=152268 RepID=A0A5C6W658_9BACI|nr:DUF5658 family protein [Metabacillus litoralis]TXC92347.1 hypothetical protein FS935_04645 [Metabacillus litoralis]
MRQICYYLALLNFIDGLLTFIGLKLNLISEVNIVMKMVYEADPIYFLLLKFFLSILLFTLSYYQKVPNHKGIKMISFVGAFLYTVVMFIHFYWVIDFIY